MPETTSRDKSKAWVVLDKAPVWPVAFILFCIGFSGEVGRVLDGTANVLDAWAGNLTANEEAARVVLENLDDRLDAVEDALRIAAALNDAPP